jgi:energy-coupling factor transporter ATP-binding protein EcfA2
LSANLSYGQQRQLEIALALAGAPRFILFDEPAAGLSPTERSELVSILTSGCPRHIGFIIIEHDMDVALRVAESVTMMHNGRVFKEGTPARRSRTTPRCRSSIWGMVMADAAMPSAAALPRPPCWKCVGLNVYYGASACACRALI